MIPASGSAYTYSYVVFGELIAWFVGWSLILEYSLVVSAVSVGWSGYFSPLGRHPGAPRDRADAWRRLQLSGGLHHLRSIAGAADLWDARKRDAQRDPWSRSRCLRWRCSSSSRCSVFDADIFHPFMPYGFAKHGPPGAEVGVMAAAAIIFFAFYGFDAIATAAEEAKNPCAISPLASSDRCCLRPHLHGGRGGSDRRRALSPLRQQRGTARTDPARHRPAPGAQAAGAVRFDRHCRP